MAKVPLKIANEVKLRPDSTVDLTAEGATPEAFGAGKGRALQQVAGGLDDAATAALKVDALKDQATVDKVATRFQDFARERTYNPQTGYANTQGENAVNGRTEFNNDINSTYDKMRKGLTPAQQRLFDKQVSRYKDAALDTGIKHASKQSKTFVDQSSAGLVKAHTDTAVEQRNEPEKYFSSVNTGAALIRERGEREGWGKIQTDLAVMEHKSQTHKKAVLAEANKNILAAEAMYKRLKPGMLEADRVEVEKTMKAPLLEAHAIVEANKIMNNPAYADTPGAPTRVRGEPAARILTAGPHVDVEGLKPDTKTAFGRLQSLYGAQLRVTSGVRSKSANAISGGAVKSRHMQGDALDIDVRGWSEADKLKLIQSAYDAGFTGIGVGPNIIHVDQGKVRSWGYITSAGGGPVPAYARGLVERNQNQLRAGTKKHSSQATTQSTRDLYRHLLSGPESSFGKNRKSKTSSALGKWQFTKGTWEGLIKNNAEDFYKRFPKVKGMSSSQIAALRNNDRVASVVVDYLLDEHIQTLKNKGVEPTMSAMHMMHIFGPRGANIITANPNTPLRDIVSREQLNANKKFRNFTAGQMLDFSRKHFGRNADTNIEREQQRAPGNQFAGPGVPPEEAYVGPIHIERATAHIKDPVLRNRTAKKLYTLEQQREASRKRGVTAAKLKAEKMLFDDPNMTPNKIPVELQRAIGMKGMNVLHKNFELRKNGNIVTDPEVYHKLTQLQAENPDSFARDVNLFDYMNHLSQKDYRKFRELQVRAIRDQGKAMERGASITKAMTLAKTRLIAAGVKKTGKALTKSAARREASFQNALVQRIDEFMKAEKHPPSPEEVSRMIDQLLLPIIIREPGFLWDSKTDAYMFEAGRRPDGSTVELNVQYGDIDINTRSMITKELTEELGREPEEDEVTAEYERFLIEGK